MDGRPDASINFPLQNLSNNVILDENEHMFGGDYLDKLLSTLTKDEIELISSNHLPKMQIKFFIVELIQDIKEIFKN